MPIGGDEGMREQCGADVRRGEAGNRQTSTALLACLSTKMAVAVCRHSYFLGRISRCGMAVGDDRRQAFDGDRGAAGEMARRPAGDDGSQLAMY